MKKLAYWLFPFIFIVSALNAQIEINISGTIVNQADFPVKNMAVVLAKEGFSDTSDVDGIFEIIESTPINNSYTIHKPNLAFKGANFVITITDGNKPVSIDIYNLKGAVVATVMKNRVLSRGDHVIPLYKKISHLSSSVLIAVVKRGSDMYHFRIVKTGGNRFTIRDFTHSNLSTSQTWQTSGRTLALDSLVFIRKVIVQGQEQVIQEYSIPIDKWVDEFEVILDLIPYEAVDFGVQEFNAGRIWPDEVGDTLTEYPNAIKNYLDKTGLGPHDYEWWCSEYYSYALRVGECPLYSSSSNPDWMIDGNTILRSWFRNNSEYIEKNNIGNFKPLPGDFCHIEGHAAMVWYIDDTDSLYTVEANGDLNGDGTFDNQMALVNRGPFKNFTDLLGYGQRTGFIGSSHQSISR